MITVSKARVYSYYNEFNPQAAAWLRELIKQGLIADGEVDERSIVDVEASDIRGFTQCHWFAGVGGWSYSLRLAGIPDDFPVWSASLPCQPFSCAGNQQGKMTIDTYCHTTLNSLDSASLQSNLESKLKARLSTGGSMTCLKNLEFWDMKQLFLLFLLLLLVRLTYAVDYIGLL